MKTSKEQVAQRIATDHYESEPAITDIFRIIASPEEERDDAEPIKLLEVNDDTVPAGIEPLYFGPHVEGGKPYAWIIVDITPVEYRDLLCGRLKLPQGWTIGERIEKCVTVED